MRGACRVSAESHPPPASCKGSTGAFSASVARGLRPSPLCPFSLALPPLSEGGRRGTQLAPAQDAGQKRAPV